RSRATIAGRPRRPARFSSTPATSPPAGARRASRRSTIISSIAELAGSRRWKPARHGSSGRAFQKGMRTPFIANPASLAHHGPMMGQLPAVLFGNAALALAACATPVPPGEVTRLHTIASPGWASGTRYVVERAPLADPAAMADRQPSLEWNSYRVAVERQLQL